MILVRSAVVLAIITAATGALAQASSADRMPGDPNTSTNSSASNSPSPTVTKMDRDTTGSTAAKRDCIPSGRNAPGISDTTSQGASVVNPDCAVNETPK
jgi:hypothetical protein